MLRPLLLSLFVCLAARVGEPKVELDPFVVHGRERTLAIPCSQLLDLSARAAPSFTLTNYTLRPNHDATLAQPLRLLLRRADGGVLHELPDATGVHALDPRFRDTLASSNQPERLNNFYLLLRAACLREPGGVNYVALRQLLDDYAAFAAARFDEARKHYEMKKHDDFADWRRQILPDEVVVFLRGEAQATALAIATSGTVDGRAVRLSRNQLVARDSDPAADPFAALDWTAIECVAPWRQGEPLPEVVDGGALLLVGWMTYRSHWLARPRYEMIMVGLVRHR